MELWKIQGHDLAWHPRWLLRMTSLWEQRLDTIPTILLSFGTSRRVQRSDCSFYNERSESVIDRDFSLHEGTRKMPQDHNEVQLFQCNDRKKILKEREFWKKRFFTKRKHWKKEDSSTLYGCPASPITWDRINPPPPPGSKPSIRAKIKQQRLKDFKRPKLLYVTLREWKKKRVIPILVVEGQTATVRLVLLEKKWEQACQSIR